MSEGADKPGRARPRDPSAEKARDLSRQRKIASNRSDKAARRNAPAIKASANRAIRRADRQNLEADHALGADALRDAHRRKDRHWGSDLAADVRAANAARRTDYEAGGGRKEIQAARRATYFATLSDAALLRQIENSIGRFPEGMRQTLDRGTMIAAYERIIHKRKR